MRRYVCFAAVAFLLGTSVLVHAQTIPGLVQDRFKLMVGDWESETTWNGTVTRTTWTARPSGGKAGLAINLKMEDPAGSSFRGYEAVHYDARLKAVVYHGVTSRGGFWRVAYDQLTENQWKGHGTGMWDGKPWESDTCIDWTPDGVRYEDVTEGKPYVIVGKRVKNADASEGTQPKVEDMAWLVGQWEGEYTLPESSLDTGQAGAKVVSTNNWQWSLKKGYMTLRLRDMINGKVSYLGYEIVGTNESNGELGHWIFGTVGGHGEGVWSNDGKNWTLKWHAVIPDGKGLSATSQIKYVDENTYTWQMVDMTDNGKKVPDWPMVTYRRIIPEADGTNFWDEYVELVKGTWDGTGTMGADNKKLGLSKGDAFTYQMTMTPHVEVHSCECAGVFKVAAKDHTNQVRGVAGWDPTKKEVHWIAFWGGGLIEELFLTHCEDGKLYGIFLVKRNNGKVEKNGIVLDYSKPGTMEARFTSGPRKGEVLSSWKRR